MPRQQAETAFVSLLQMRSTRLSGDFSMSLPEAEPALESIPAMQVNAILLKQP
jgi:hypothetical protein